MSYELIVGDPHLKVSNLENVKIFLDWILSLVKKEDIDRVVILGDVFHTHAVVRTEVVNLFTSFLRNVTKNTKIILIVGNHDMASHRQEDVHALEAYKEFANVYVIDKPTIMNGDLFIPFMSSGDAWQLVWDQFSPIAKHIYCHQMFIGADMGFIKSTDGIQIPNHTCLIINGHIHKGQMMTGTSGNKVWCPGSPYAQEASDVDQDKGVFLFDKSTDTAILKESPLPQWHTFHASVSDYETVIGYMNKKDRNHLILSGPSTELTAILSGDTFKKLKKEFKFSLRKESTSNEKIKTSRVSSKSIKDAVTSYIDNVYDGSVDKNTLKSKCLEVLGDG